MNENGQRLLELCTYHDLCIANSYFRTKPQHKVSWRHPRSKHWHQLDLILFRRAALKNVLHTRSYHSADCNTDHSLVCCKIRLQPKRFHRTKKQGNPVFMSARCHNQTSCHNLRRLLRERVRRPTTQRRCLREVGNSPRHHAPHSPGYLRGKVLKDSRLV